MSGNVCFKCAAALEPGARFCGGCGSPQPAADAGPAKASGKSPALNRTLFQGGGTPRAAPSQPNPIVSASPKPAASSASAKLVEKIAPKAAEPPEDLTGQTLNQRYLVEDRVGQGGFGTVYRAIQVQMSRKVALKVLHPKMAKDPQVVERFRREAQASSLLRAPHTVQVYDFDRTPDGTLYLAMEFLEGQSLHEVFGMHGKLEPVRLAHVIDGIAESLGEAHGQGIVHRDIKPENVFLEPRPEPDFVKVLDFGIAKIISGEAGGKGPQLTAVGQTLGTVEYMSPEQLMGLPLDGRSDLYAVGIMAYELLVGRLPFAGTHATDIIAGHLKGVPKPPTQALGQSTPQLAAWDTIILKLLEKKKEGRYANASELRKALAPMIAGTLDPEEQTATRVNPVISADPADHPELARRRADPEPANSPARTERRDVARPIPMWMPVAGAVVIIAVIVLLAVFIKH